MSVTLFIILFTSAFSMTALYLQPRLLEWGLLHPYRAVRNRNWHELITSGLLHAYLGHLFANMFVLLFFGLDLKRALGPVLPSALYVCGLLAAAIRPLIQSREDPRDATLGASGAAGSVLFAFIFLYPTETLYLFLLPIPSPAWLF